MKHLVIVESPAKAKTIQKYLGAEHIVHASVGHIRDLKKKNMGIDLATFEPDYEVPKDKQKIVSELRKLAKKTDQVWIATDEDREGEAIGWHLCEALGLDIKTTSRITYTEITQKAIETALKNPRTLDMNLVSAQQARRILDRIVGFEVSPVLWKKVPSATTLSAGRVQSVAVRLVVDREKAIEAFIPKESWKLQVHLERRIVADLYKIQGKTPRIKSQEDAKRFLGLFSNHIEFTTKGKDRTSVATLKHVHDFTLDVVQKTQTERIPGPPFTTSTLQQEASRKLGFGVKKTMTLAQHLYQNGLISYMRTDSVHLSDDAIHACRGHILQNFGESYAMRNGRKYKSKIANAQEAHEAIRPTHIDQDPRHIHLTGDEFRLYKLIWDRTVASQMQTAKVETTTYTFVPVGVDQTWQTKGQVILFDGYMKLYTEGKDDDEEQEGEVILPVVEKGSTLKSQSFMGLQSFSRAPGRYTEATLVKKLESEGIGRPSTYASTISTIQDRGYVQKKLKHLHPTSLARIVNEFLEKNFSQMVDYTFTATIEEEFDKISRGEKQWKKMLQNFYQKFHPQVEQAGSSQRVTGERILGTHPTTGVQILVRMARYGPCIQIGESTAENKPTYASIPAGLDMESISLEQALELASLPRILGTKDGQEVKAGIGKYGPYVALGKTYASIHADTGFTAYTITLEQALTCIDQKLSKSGNVIATYGDIQVLRGKYGPYLKQGKNNLPLPKEYHEDLGKLDEALCAEIIQTKLAQKTPKKKRSPVKRKKK